MGTAKYNADEWIARAHAVHGGKYEYRKETFSGMFSKVTIICPEHGDFEQLAANHVHKKTGCPKCAAKARARKQAYTTDGFVAKARAVHGDTYDYSRVTYVDSTTPVTIVCRTHGPFLQRPAGHLQGKGCPACGELKKGAVPKTTERFISDSRRIHGDTYDYTLARYNSAREPLQIVCKVHGVFEQTPDAHLAGKGCPKCVHHVSRWESEIKEFLTALGVDVVERQKSLIAPYEIDLYAPAFRIGVECHGLYFHSTRFIASPTRHLRKHIAAERAGIRLIQLFEDEWTLRRLAVCNFLAAQFGACARVYARNYRVINVNWSDAKTFFDTYHLQGAPRGGECYGLVDDNGIVAVMAFSKVTSERGATNAGWELVRYASKDVVIGGAAKLFAAFLRKHSPDRVISYSDRRLFTGVMYSRLGFKFAHFTRPNYFVLDGHRRRHKANYKKALLKARFGIDVTGNTEREICESLGLYRIYDCGLAKWVWS